MPDLSPNYMKITTSYDAKKGSNSQRGIGSVDVISVDSSELCTQKKDDKIKNRPVMKKIMKNFGSTRSFRRRSSRSITTMKNHNPAKSLSDYAASPQNPSSGEFSESSSPPHYRNPTSCSEGKSCESSFDSSDQSRSPRKFSQTLSRTTSMRSVKILINKSSFKSKKGTSKCCKIPDKATCSSTIKDSKFKEHVEFHPGQTEPDRMSKFKVCSYHHCSLHGGHHDDPLPPVKRVYRRKRWLKSQKSIRAKREFTVDENALLENTQLSPSLDPSVCEQSSAAEDAGDFHVNEAIEYADLAEIDFGEKQNSGTEDAAFFKVNEAIEYADLAEIAFGETSFPEQSYKETLNIMNKYSTQEQGSLLTASNCCSCMARGRSDSKDDSGFSFLLKQGDSVSTSGEDGSSKREFSKVGPFTTSTRPVFDIFSGAEYSNVTASPAISGNNGSNNGELSKDGGAFTTRTRPVFDIFYGAKCSNEISSISASNIQLEHGDMQEKDGKADPNEDLVRTSGLVGDSKSKNCPPVEVAEPKKKYMNMWSLIRRHMVSDASAEPENKPASGANDEENHQDGANKSPSAESSSSCSDFAERELIPANEDAESQEIELRKLFTIKLVREAIEKILLPEVQSDNQSVTSESSVDQESFEMSHSQDSKNEEADAGSKPKTPYTEDIGSSKKEITRKEVKNNSEKRAPKHWSNLKKWILLQRFVKELEKVRKINPRRPRYLQLNPVPEAEKVDLIPQTADERKRGEEWMLDYALQQAISQLAPTQQRKVELLIKAFETVVPPQGDNSQVAFPKLRASSEEHLLITRKENEFMSKAEKVIAGIDRKREENDCSMYKNHAVQQSQLRQKLGEVTSASNDEDLVEGKVRKEDQEHSSNDSRKETSSSISSLTVAVDGAQEDVRSIVRDRKFGFENHDGVMNETSNTTQSSTADGDKNSLTAVGIQSSTSASDAATQENVAMVEAAKECEKTPKPVRGFSLLLSMSDTKEDDGASKGQADKRSYISMWHMISRHVLSDVASKVGNELLDGTDDEVEDINTPTAMKSCNSLQDFSETKDDADTSREDHYPSHHGRSFCRDDAVKLIREAVNEILTTPIQDDSSDTQSVTSDIIPDQELSEAEGETKNSSNSTESLIDLDMTEGGNMLDQERKDPKEERALPLAKNKPEPQKSKNWSKLKKLILLKRSIKALERARKFNPRAPQLLPLTPDQEPEKVDLRHQMTDERKKAEKWMLDYAMQNIVTTLTPARKRRVAMLVEAFEAVVPLPEV
ncbi:hypothetical protein HAX54_040546 [Datura stramonium]|uniref:Calmodulin-binding domain-containing protein n=1 Tax=Datura stramonium TaxID=4076 RepID=A0ABS8SKK4_DATST|nr:hypothetical protein [Datura stramonium]